jgi:hypothetical protein
MIHKAASMYAYVNQFIFLSVNNTLAFRLFLALIQIVINKFNKIKCFFISSN